MPFVEFTNNMASRDGIRIRFVIEVFVMAGPVGLVLMPFGFRRLWRAETQRWLAVVVGTGLAILLVLAGKGYYAAPFYVPMLAAAAVHFDPGTTPDRRARRRGALVAGLLAAQLVLVLPVTLPVLPPRVLAETDLDATFTPLAEQTGWPETIDDVEEVSTDLTPVEREHAVILAASYGEAGALDVLGSDALPPVVSAHNQYWFWGPPADTTDTVIGVRYQAATLAPFFDTCEQVAVFENAAGIATEVAGTPVVLCRGRRAEWPAIWDDLQHFE